MTHRDNFKKSLLEIIKDKNIVKKIEEGIFDFTNQHLEINNTPIFLLEEIYENKANELLSILSLSTDLLKLIEENKILPEKIAFMKNEELNPGKYEQIFKQKEILSSNNKKGVTTFECKKCHERNSEITQKQTRSGDEPPSTFITCLNCGYKYKFG